MRANPSTDAPARVARARAASLCAVCHGWGRQRLCDDCIEQHAALRARCRRCALAIDSKAEVCGTCLSRPPSWRQALAAVDYAFPWDRLVAAYKFDDALDLAAVLAGLLVRAHRQRAHAPPSLLLPVPLSAQRLRERGYNQAWELARRVGRNLACPADPTLLLRLRDTPHQIVLPPDQRAASVKGAFAVEPRRLAEVRGRHLTLVDDVMTTGATAREITEMLLGAGAATVDVWVVARTPLPGASI